MVQNTGYTTGYIVMHFQVTNLIIRILQYILYVIQSQKHLPIYVVVYINK